MLRKVDLRALTEKEQEALKKLIKSQTARAIEVKRAKTVWLAHQGEKVMAISQKLDRTPATIYRLLQRFNELGLQSLADEAR